MNSLRVKRGLWLALCVIAFGGVGHAQNAVPVQFVLPSGHVFKFLEALQEPADAPLGQVYRFRFVAPQLAADAGGQKFEDVSDDMQLLCQDYALPKLAEMNAVPTQVVISLSERPVDFGVAAPDVTQFFEAYSIEDGHCIWEMF